MESKTSKRRELLSGAQGAQLLALPTGIRELEERCSFTPSDLEFIGAHRTNSDRLGIAVQLCFLRHPGWAWTEESIPGAMLRWIAAQVSADPGDMESYAKRDPTRREHFLELLQEYNWRSFGLHEYREMSAWSITQARSTDQGMTLITLLISELRHRRIVVPVLPVLERLTIAARSRARREAYRALNGELTFEQRQHLDQLLELRGESGQTWLGWLCQAIGAANPNNILAENRARKPMRASTVKRQRDILSKFLKDTLVESVSEVNREKVDHWLERLKKSGRSPDTLRTYAQALRSFVGYLVKERLHSGAGFEKFDLPEGRLSGRKNWLQSDVANRVIAESRDPDLTFILLCGFDAGLRKSEIIAAKVKWFDLRAGLLHVQNDPGSGFVLKDRENRAIPLTEKFQKFLEGHLVNRDPDSYVLKPGQLRGRAEYRYDFKRLLYTHFKRCGVKCSIHDMRRSFASNRVSQGRSIYKVAKWLGDGVLVVEKSYGHLAPADRDIDIDVSGSGRAPRVSEDSTH